MEEVQYLYQLNEGYHLVDALPYIDSHQGGTVVDQQVKDLIQQEMKTFEPKKYLEFLPLPEARFDGDLVAQEMDRIGGGIAMQGVSMQRYSLDPPVSAGDVEAWQDALRNAVVQRNHFQLRMMNLELLDAWGTKLFLQNKSVTQKLESHQEQEIRESTTKLESINKRRKLEQVSWGNDLRNLQHEYEQRVAENGEALLGIQRLKQEIAHVKTICEDRGVLPEDWADKLDSEVARVML